jgi:serine/threonine-protein kinase ULK3
MEQTSIVYLPKLKNYIIDKRLGRGSYAIVYRAHQKHSNENVAIKVIQRKGLNSLSTENLIREIKILKEIRHDHVVELIDFDWDETNIYLIMEYCAGGDLSTFIKSKRTIPERYVKRFVQQIASALRHLNLRAIAHMDLKPQNILLTSVKNPMLKIADFGFAQYFDDSDHGKSFRGSPLYMAPEILKCKNYDSKADLWSVGVILFEVIFGYAPFSSPSIDELKVKILSDDPIIIPNHIQVSTGCRDLLQRLLKRNPSERMSFDDFFSHSFVDLEHMASEDSYPKAVSLLSKAVHADEMKNYLTAQKYYLEAIEYLLPAIQYEKSDDKKNLLRIKSNKYIQRAEEIKKLLHSKETNKNNNKKETLIPIEIVHGSNSSNNDTRQVHFKPTMLSKLSLSETETSSFTQDTYSASENNKTMSMKRTPKTSETSIDNDSISSKSNCLQLTNSITGSVSINPLSTQRSISVDYNHLCKFVSFIYDKIVF